MKFNSTFCLFLICIFMHINFANAQMFNWAQSTIAFSELKIDNSGNIVGFASVGSSATIDTVFLDNKRQSFYIDSIHLGCSLPVLVKYNSCGDYIWHKQLTDSCTLALYGIKVDADNNIYTIGQFKNSIRFLPYDPNQQIISSKGAFDIILSKFSPNGTLIWNHTFGSSFSDVGTNLFIKDSLLYITGEFQDSVDFDFSPATQILKANNGGNNINTFVAKYNLNADLIWAKSFTGGLNRGRGLAVDEQNNILTSILFNGTSDFNPDPLSSSFATATYTSGNYDICLVKLDPNGQFKWKTHIKENVGGFMNDHSIATDKNGTLYLCGSMLSSDSFDVNPNGASNFIHKKGLVEDFYFAKFNSSGVNEWAFPFGGSKTDRVFDVATDTFNNVFFTSIFSDSIDANPGVGQVIYRTSASNNPDAIIQAFSSNGQYIYSNHLASPITDEISAMDLKNDNLLFNIVSNKNIDLDPGTGVYNPISPSPSVSSLVSYRIFDSIPNSIADTSLLNFCLGDTVFYADKVLTSDTVITENLYCVREHISIFRFKAASEMNIVYNACKGEVFTLFGLNYEKDTIIKRIKPNPNGCDTFMYHNIVFNILPPNANFTDSISSYIAYFTNTSSNAVTYSWNFGDSTSSNSTNIAHTYANPGKYLVSLSASNAQCDSISTIKKQIIIENKTSINELPPFSFSLFPNPNNGVFDIAFFGNFEKEMSLNLYSSVGQLMYQNALHMNSNKKEIHLNFSDFPAGIYTLILNDNKFTFTKKIVIY